MIHLNVPADVITVSREYMRYASLGNRGDGSDGSYDEQLIGVMGENLFRFAVGLPFMEYREWHDNGVDCEVHDIRLDVKTMGRTTEPQLHYANNLVAKQINFDVDGYVFMSINRQAGYSATVCGWLPKPTFMERAILHPKGSERMRGDGSSFQTKSDMYEIRNDQLRHEPATFPELFLSIHKYSQHLKQQQQPLAA